MSEVNVRKHEKNSVLQDDTEKIADFKRLNQSSLLRSLVGKHRNFLAFADAETRRSRAKPACFPLAAMRRVPLQSEKNMVTMNRKHANTSFKI